MSFVDLLPKSVTGVIAYAVVLWTLALSGYRLLLHPLRNIPGPLLATQTAWYSGIFAIQKRLHMKIWELHERYGPVVRLAPDRLVFNSPRALRDIYQNDRIVKSTNYQVTVQGGVVNVFNAIDRDVHRAKRRLVGEAVTEKAMRRFEPTMASYVDHYLGLIAAAASDGNPVVNVTAKTRHLALDIVCELAFGYDLGTMTREDNRFMLTGMTFGNWRGNVYMHMPFLASLYLKKPFDYLFYKARERYWRLVEKMLRSRMAMDTHAKADLYSHVAGVYGVDKDNLRGGDLWLEGIFFLIAGGDTTATAICAAFFYLSRKENAACYRRVVGEVRGAFKSGKDIKGGPAMAGCTYLRACINEALRMSPPTSTTLWREQDRKDTSSEPIVVDGVVIPKGTMVGVNVYAINHNKDVFPDPFAYKPERWLDDGRFDEATKRRMNETFSPFSVGPRGCAGKAMAYLELSLVLAKTIWYFDFERAPGELGVVGGGNAGDKRGRYRTAEYQLEDVFSSRHDGPYLVFRPRKGDDGVELCRELD